MNESNKNLYRFLQDIYGNEHLITRVEVEVEAQSGGIHGTPHLEATKVRVYSGIVLLLPHFVELAYWQEILKVYPYLFEGCETPHEHLDMMQELFESEHLYSEYDLDWSYAGGQVISPLCFTVEQLTQADR